MLWPKRAISSQHSQIVHRAVVQKCAELRHRLYEKAGDLTDVVDAPPKAVSTE